MYLTIEDTAEYLSMETATILSYIIEGRIRAVHDGEQYLINKAQFVTHFKEVEKYRQMMIDYLNEPIPEDIDVKDED